MAGSTGLFMARGVTDEWATPGNTTEPHLHLHATDGATGHAAPVTLAGITPARGRLLDCR
jgi:hypothetical protein